MILIVKNTENKVIVTLNENLLANDLPYYFLFEFINDTSKDKIYFTAEDISNSTASYNYFLITESDTADLYNGIISLELTGYYTYNIYQMTQSSPISLDVADAIKKLETGKVFVKSNVEDVVYKYIPTEKKIYSYNK